MKKYSMIGIMAFAMLVFAGCGNQDSSGAKADESAGITSDEQEPAGNDIKPEYLTAKMFKEKIWNYESNPEQWVYNGDLPCVVDFYADWCKPCKMVAPIMDDLADYYDGKVRIYKVNTDEQQELAAVFQVRSIPSILFAPMDGKPAMQAGAMSKEDYIRIIDEYVLKVNEQNNEQSENL